MVDNKRFRIVLAGAGNVAWHLFRAFEQGGHEVLQVYARSPQALERFGVDSARRCLSPDKIDREADFYVLAVSDRAVVQVSDALPENQGVIVHTAGSLPISVLSKHAGRCGVLYPFQTLTAGHEVDFAASVPLLIEADSPSNALLIKDLAVSLSRQVVETNSDTRRMLHVCAVFASNFTNHLLAVADQLALDHGVDFELLRPLVEATVNKAFTGGPQRVQTGPAVRGDTLILESHIALLKKYPLFAEVYQLLSRSISTFAAKENQRE